MFVILIYAAGPPGWEVWNFSLNGGYFTQHEAENQIMKNGGPGISYCIVEVKNVVTPQPTPTTILIPVEWR